MNPKHKQYLIAAALVCGLAATTIRAQTAPKMNVTTPDSAGTK